ncbi:MAG TPA: phosphoribosylanthranilate isomerase [Cellvibrio sp.]|nr:phosphoribosylanthranilate isomerase [Cellvibrio sp.]
MTSVADALAAEEAGADAIGLVFYGPSPRAIDIDHAQEIAHSVGPFVTTVGLFVNAEPAYVSEVLSRVPLHVLQFHGDETSTYCESFCRPYMKAIRMRPALNLTSAIASYSSAAAILLDAYCPGIPGGTGETFDWQRVPQNTDKAIILAGGLTSANVAEAIQTTNVYGVDVSGGVESAPGKKDAFKVREFIINASHGSNR